jgi:hypothetical protein
VKSIRFLLICVNDPSSEFATHINPELESKTSPSGPGVLVAPTMNSLSFVCGLLL